MADYLRKNIITIHLIILIFFALIMGYQSRFTFLIWNVILAVIPFDLSLLCHLLKQKKRRYLLALIWFLFFPNALYMITDFSHLSSIGVGLITPLQFVEYAILAAGVFIGISLGIVSLLIMYPLFIPQATRFSHQLTTFGLLSICSSIAIYLGRFLRINSWDVFVSLPTTVTKVFAIFNQADFWIFVIAFSILQLTLMLASYQFQQVLTANHPSKN